MASTAAQQNAGPSTAQAKESTPEQRQAFFELHTSLTLFFWPVLTFAVSENLGGGDSLDKRDWFTGSLVSLFEADPATDEFDVESMLLQVMLDEFELAVDDDSSKDVAEQIVRGWKNCMRGDFKETEELRERWEKRGGKAEKLVFQRGLDVEEEGEWSSGDEEEEDSDVEMEEAPQLVERKSKPEPEVDEEGFTKVERKKR